MTRRQWWLKNLAVVGISGVLAWSPALTFKYRFVFPVLVPCLFFLALGIGMGWILFPVLNPPGKTRSKYTFLFGLSSLFSASISIVFSFVLAFLFTLVFFVTLDTFDIRGFQLLFWINKENSVYFFNSFLVSLTLLASLFAGWSFGRILARVMSWYSSSSSPSWFTSLDSAGAFAGLSMGIGLVVFFATGKSGYTLDLPDLWVIQPYSIPISLATALLMATSLSHFTYPLISKVTAASPAIETHSET